MSSPLLPRSDFCRLVAITGGAGFIGSHLAEGFVRKGYAVRVLDNLTTGSITNLARIKNDVDYQKVDIRDLEALTKALRGASIVLHHAGLSSVPRSFQDLPYTHDVNVTGTLNVFTAAVRSRDSSVHPQTCGWRPSDNIRGWNSDTRFYLHR
jgi:nucleoside-diphosphate-sugar epimerase